MQVLNSYGKVLPTQPPSGRPVGEAPLPGVSWERHVDEHDVENSAEKPDRKQSIGMACHVALGMLLFAISLTGNMPLLLLDCLFVCLAM